MQVNWVYDGDDAAARAYTRPAGMVLQRRLLQMRRPSRSSEGYELETRPFVIEARRGRLVEVNNRGRWPTTPSKGGWDLATR